MAITKCYAGVDGAPYLSGTAGAMIAVLDYFLVTKLGWTKPYSGTNQAVYKSGVGDYLKVVDTGATTFTVQGYETMSALATGTVPYPSSGALTITKSDTASAANREWQAISNGSTFILHLNTVAGGGFTNSNSLLFGRIKPIDPAIAYNSFIWANQGGNGFTPAWTNDGRAAFPRSYDGSVGGFDMNRIWGMVGQTPVESGSTNFPPPPNKVLGGILLDRWFARELGTVGVPFRGVIPGLWGCANDVASLSNRDTISGGSGALAGKTFELWKTYYGGVWIETSDTW